MAASISGRAVHVPDDVLMRELDGEAVLVHLDGEVVFVLDDVGARMWARLTTAPSSRAAYEALLTEYDVAPEILRHDLEDLLGQLLDHGLLELRDG